MQSRNQGLRKLKLAQSREGALQLKTEILPQRREGRREDTGFWGAPFRALILLLFSIARLSSAEVLIVADEFPAMQVVATKLKSDAHIESTLLSQDKLPPTLTNYEAVVVYIHGALSEKAEDAFIDYTQTGGKLVLLHHSISSGKRKNPHWFKFLGVSLPEGDLSQDGYKWIEGISFELVNLNPNHFIMTNQIRYPEQIAYSTTNVVNSSTLPGFKLAETEVYINHVHTEPRTLLMGLKFTYPTNRITYMQDRAGWLKPAGKGWIIYLMPGHTKHDFESPIYGQIVLNAVTWASHR